MINGIRSQTSTLESNLSQDAIQPPHPPRNNPPPEDLPPLEPVPLSGSPRRPARTSTLV
ncbi:unnamed protein product [Haemonchus placei]|uniref:Uncharacterized protein n=1 Tax=Haemonchus placei TaxID=6290 RepID=A0A3P7TRV9_HAEPC|nr:unnamed protein product [Haemonchus placei]